MPITNKSKQFIKIGHRGLFSFPLVKEIIEFHEFTPPFPHLIGIRFYIGSIHFVTHCAYLITKTYVLNNVLHWGA